MGRDGLSLSVEVTYYLATLLLDGVFELDNRAAQPSNVPMAVAGFNTSCWSASTVLTNVAIVPVFTAALSLSPSFDANSCITDR